MKMVRTRPDKVKSFKDAHNPVATYVNRKPLNRAERRALAKQNKDEKA